MTQPEGPPGASHADHDPLLNGGQAEPSLELPTAPAGGLASVLGRAVWWVTRSGGAAPPAQQADDIERNMAGTSAPSADARRLGDGGDLQRRPSSAGNSAQATAGHTQGGEIGPNTDAAHPGHSDAMGDCGTGASSPPGRNSGEEAAKRRSSSSSPRSQEGQGLLDRFLGNIAGSLSLKRANSAAAVAHPTCLICLENLTPEDFECGEAIQLDCACRGEMALRHRACAEKWSRVKGDRICDICKKEIKNLPELPPRSSESEQDPMMDMAIFDDGEHPGHPHGLHGPFMGEVPGSADVVFDLIRVTWVAMIICILFLEMNLAPALWTGLIVGVAYTLFVRLMYRSQMAALQREYAREQAAMEQSGGSVTGVPVVPGLPRIATVV